MANYLSRFILVHVELIEVSIEIFFLLYRGISVPVHKYRNTNHIILEIISKTCKCFLQIRIQVKRSCKHHLQVNNQ